MEEDAWIIVSPTPSCSVFVLVGSITKSSCCFSSAAGVGVVVIAAAISPASVFCMRLPTLNSTEPPLKFEFVKLLKESILGLAVSPSTNASPILKS